MIKVPSLVSYSESSSDEDQEQHTTKRKGKPLEDDVKHIKKKQCLPVPDDIRQLFDSSSTHIDNPNQHDGRIRSFAHEAGNWATLVFIPYSHDERFMELQQSLFTCLRPLEFEPMTNYHVSLSRTVSIRHHWIPSLTESFQKSFRNIDSFACEITAVKLFTNDEKTRSFLGLEVSCGSDSLETCVREVDLCLQEYRLPVYYKPAVFHISIGWCLQDVVQKVSPELLNKLQEKLRRFLQENEEMKYFDVDTAQCKTGNKLFDFPLAET